MCTFTCVYVHIQYHQFFMSVNLDILKCCVYTNICVTELLYVCLTDTYMYVHTYAHALVSIYTHSSYVQCACIYMYTDNLHENIYRILCMYTC